MGKATKKTAAVEETAAVNTENTTPIESVEAVAETTSEEVIDTVEDTATIESVEDIAETTSEEVVDTVAETSTEEVVETVAEIDVQNVEIIPSGVFVSESGNEYEFTVQKFLFKGKKYQVQEAIANHTDVLEELVSLNSFILKLK